MTNNLPTMSFAAPPADNFPTMSFDVPSDEQQQVEEVTQENAAPTEPETKDFGFGGKSFEEVTESVYQSFENMGFPMREIQELPNEVMSKYLGELASVAGASKGMNLASKLPIGHPLLKGAVTLGGSAVFAGWAQFFGELGEDVWNGSPLEYRQALDKGVATAKWDAAGGLALGSLGTITRKALQTAGIKTVSDAKQTARKLLQEYGADLTWYQTTGSKLSAIVEGIGLVGLGGREVMKSAEKRAEVALGRHLDTFFTPTGSQEFGSNIVNIVNNARKDLSKAYGPQYTAIYEAAKDIPIDLSKYNISVIDDIAARAGARKTKNAPSSNPHINDVNSIVTDLEDVTNMSDLNNVLKELKKIQRASDDVGGAVGREGRRYASKRIKELDSIMGDSAERLAPDLKKKLDFLNFNFKAGIKKLESTTMLKAMRKDPSEIGAWLYRNPDKNKDFMKFLGQARSLKTISKAEYDIVLKDYRSGYIKTLLREEGATLEDMTRLGHTLKKAKNRERLHSVVSLPVEKRLMAILDTAELARTTGAGTKFSLIVASKQAEAAKALVIGGVAMGSGGTSAALMLGTPFALAKAASTAKTFGEWMKMNTGFKRASQSGDLKALEILSKRATQWMSENEEEKQ
jgi:hypothetical protein